MNRGQLADLAALLRDIEAAECGVSLFLSGTVALLDGDDNKIGVLEFHGSGDAVLAVSL